MTGSQCFVFFSFPFCQWHINILVSHCLYSWASLEWSGNISTSKIRSFFNDKWMLIFLSFKFVIENFNFVQVSNRILRHFLIFFVRTYNKRFIFYMKSTFIHKWIDSCCLIFFYLSFWMKRNDRIMKSRKIVFVFLNFVEFVI